MTAREIPIFEQLASSLIEFDKAIDRLRIAYERARTIDLASISVQEDITLEAFTARFARASDIHLRKILRSIDLLELEESGTLIDVLNRAEKRGIIRNAAEFRDIRSRRNDIAHDYVLEDLVPLYAECLRLAPALLDSLEPAKRYVLALKNKLR